MAGALVRPASSVTVTTTPRDVNSILLPECLYESVLSASSKEFVLSDAVWSDAKDFVATVSEYVAGSYEEVVRCSPSGPKSSVMFTKSASSAPPTALIILAFADKILLCGEPSVNDIDAESATTTYASPSLKETTRVVVAVASVTLGGSTVTASTVIDVCIHPARVHPPPHANTQVNTNARHARVNF
jgi:hypothetical protein